MVELTEGQFELLESLQEDARGLHMGAGTPVLVQEFDLGQPDISEHDANRPMADGIMFGRDFRRGRTVGLELAALSYTPAVDMSFYTGTPGEYAATEGLDWADRVQSAWAADRVRMVPGATQVLRWRAGGRVRRVYGRARRCAPKLGTYRAGTVPMSADFQTIDDLVYDDQLKATSIGIFPPPVSWTTFPLTWPVIWRKAESGNAGSVVVGGSRATWPTFTITGPILNPEIVIGGYGRFRVDVNLLAGQTLYIDTRPWNRGVRRENGANLAGNVGPQATPLGQFRFPPGSYSVALKGVDTTGTASLTVQHRDAYSSI